MAVTAQFSATPKIGMVRISGVAAANTARDGSGTEGTNIFQILTAGVNGTRVDKIHVTAAGSLSANTVGMIRVFISDGVNKRIWRDITIASATASASVAGANNFAAAKIDEGLVLQAGHSIWVTSHYSDAAGNQYDVIATGGDF